MLAGVLAFDARPLPLDAIAVVDSCTYPSEVFPGDGDPASRRQLIYGLHPRGNVDEVIATGDLHSSRCP
jgi:hypothetical protein